MARHGAQPSRKELIFPLIAGPLSLIAFIGACTTGSVQLISTFLIFVILCTMRVINFAIRSHQARP